MKIVGAFRTLLPRVAMSAAALLLAASSVFAAPPPHYQLVWNDEFNGPIGSSPNPAYWTFDNGYSIRNQEQETYGSNNARIVADPNAANGRALDIFSTNNGGVYNSSEIDSIGKVQFLYGYFECRAKLPPGGPDYMGYWPAFWLAGDDEASAGWPACGELDIMEHICGRWPLVNLETFHGITTGGRHFEDDDSYTGSRDLGDAYHLYQMLWTPTSVTFYTDGVATGTVRKSDLKSDQIWAYDNSNDPMQLRINLAIGGAPGYNRDITSQTIFPAHYLVDYVRVYEPDNYNTWLYDPGFESGSLDPLWSVSSPNGTQSAARIVPTSTDDPSHSGGYHCAEGSTHPYDVTVSQTPLILPRGTYTLTAWVRSSGGQQTCRMYVDKFDKRSDGGFTAIDIPAGDSYVRLSIPNIKVSSGECECAFHSVGSPGQWLDIDDVSLTRNYVPSKPSLGRKGPFWGSRTTHPLGGMLGPEGQACLPTEPQRQQIVVPESVRA